MNIKHQFDKGEGKLLFWIEGDGQGGPIVYADTIEEGHEKIKSLFEEGEMLKQKLKETGK